MVIACLYSFPILAFKLYTFYNMRKVWNTVYATVCAVGLIYQIHLFSSNYFKYTTTTRFKYIFKTKLNTSDMILCPRYSDIIDYVRLKRDTGISLSIEDSRHIQDHLTAEQIFKYTPKNHEILDSAFYRINTSLNLQFLNQSQVYIVYNVTRFTVSEFMCYTITRKDKELIGYEDYLLSTAPVSPSVTYEIRFSKCLQKTDLMWIMLVHSPGVDFPSYFYSPVINRLSIGKRRFNLFSATNKLYHMRLLPKPYDTGCVEFDQFISETNCWFPCINNEIRKTGSQKVTYNTFVWKENEKQKFLSHNDLLNRTIDNAFINADHVICKKKCRSVLGCKRWFSVTTKFHTSMQVGTETFIVQALVPAEPGISIHSEKWMSFEEYLIYLSTTIGIWFGLSVSSFSPFQYLIDRLRRKRGNVVQDIR